MQSILSVYPPEVLILFAGILGLLVGSFLNVVIYRLPVMMERDFRVEATCILNGEAAALKEEEAQGRFNLMVPRSRCPKCKTQITALQNIPVISWLMLRGKCAGCKTSVSARYPIIEAVTGILTALVIFKLGANWAGVGGMLLLWIRDTAVPHLVVWKNICCSTNIFAHDNNRLVVACKFCNSGAILLISKTKTRTWTTPIVLSQINY